MHEKGRDREGILELFQRPYGFVPGKCEKNGEIKSDSSPVSRRKGENSKKKKRTGYWQQ